MLIYPKRVHHEPQSAIAAGKYWNHQLAPGRTAAALPIADGKV